MLSVTQTMEARRAQEQRQVQELQVGGAVASLVRGQHQHATPLPVAPLIPACCSGLPLLPAPHLSSLRRHQLPFHGHSSWQSVACTQLDTLQGSRGKRPALQTAGPASHCLGALQHPAAPDHTGACDLQP